MLRNAQENGYAGVEISAGQLHRRVGGYPGADHRMPMACSAMRRQLSGDDEELPNSLKKDGASYTVRYKLPRAD